MSSRTPIPCPRCGKPLTRVIDTKPWQKGVLRRRECPEGHRANTIERAMGTPAA